MSHRVAIVIPAAGGSTRMRGRDKLMEPVDGQPLIALVAGRACDTGLPVLVVLPGPDHPRSHALKALPLTPVYLPASRGMGHSIATGIAALPVECDGVMILPADMPEITSDDIRAVASGFDGRRPARATAPDGMPGHPVLFPAADVPALAQLDGDDGAREVLRVHGTVTRVTLPGRHALTDLDTPEAWAAWRADRA